MSACSSLRPGASDIRCRSNMAHKSQSEPDSGLGFQVEVRKPINDVPSSLGSGLAPPLHPRYSIRSTIRENKTTGFVCINRFYNTRFASLEWLASALHTQQPGKVRRRKEAREETS